MSEPLLSSLKRLQHQRSESSPFASHVEFLRWSDQVESLLSFDALLLQEFKSSVSSAKIVHGMRNPHFRAVNEAIGTLNKAILLLETRALHPSSEKPNQSQGAPLESPPKVTVKWLYEHVPASLVATGASLLVAAFVAGLALANTDLYAFIKNTIASTNQSTASPNAKAIEKAPSTAAHISSSPR